MGTTSSTNVVTHIRNVEDTRQQDMIRQQTQQLLRSEEEAEKEWHEVHTAFKENYDRTLQEFETGREMHKETFLQTCEAMNQRVQRELERNRQVRTDCERFLTAQIEALIADMEDNERKAALEHARFTEGFERQTRLNQDSERRIQHGRDQISEQFELRFLRKEEQMRVDDEQHMEDMRQLRSHSQPKQQKAKSQQAVLTLREAIETLKQNVEAKEAVILREREAVIQRLNSAQESMSSMSERSERSSCNQSVSGLTRSKTVQDMKKTKFLALIEGLEAPAEQKSECARIFGRTNRKIADLVEDLVLRSMKGQLQTPDFKLNPGCSIVCPLIAFLEGSGGDKPEMTHQAGICETHQVNYCFTLETHDPSKLKVASFAPLQQ